MATALESALLRRFPGYVGLAAPRWALPRSLPHGTSTITRTGASSPPARESEEHASEALWDVGEPHVLDLVPGTVRALT